MRQAQREAFRVRSRWCSQEEPSQHILHPWLELMINWQVTTADLQYSLGYFLSNHFAFRLLKPCHTISSSPINVFEPGRIKGQSPFIMCNEWALCLILHLCLSKFLQCSYWHFGQTMQRMNSAQRVCLQKICIKWIDSMIDSWESSLKRPS
jgi:hypothetical protein